MKTLTWILAGLPPVLMALWINTSAFLPYGPSVSSGFCALYGCSVVLCFIWSLICILRKKSNFGFVSFGLGLIYMFLPLCFYQSL
jgi:hypothetical protein